MRVICVTGTPGTGKTTVAKKIAKALNYLYIDVKEVIKREKLSEGYDKKRKCYIVDIKKLNKLLIKMINQYEKSLKKIKNKKNGLIIDSHLSHYLPSRYVDLCIVTKCDIGKLNKRLKKRKYIQSKIKENIESEIFDVCYVEALENKHNVIVIDTTKPININPVLAKINRS